jgi:hypothetical protein
MTTTEPTATDKEGMFWGIVGLAFLGLFRLIVAVVRFMPRTLGWIALALIVQSVSWLTVLVLVLMVAVNWAGRLPAVAFLFHISPAQDWLRARARRRAKKSAEAGAEVLEQIGFGGQLVEGWLYEEGNVRRLAMRTRSGRVGLPEVTAAADRASAYMNAETVTVEETTPGEYQIRWFKVAPADPLASTQPLTAAHAPESVHAVTYGTFSNGKSCIFDFANKSGGVVGGVPGSGKSAGLTAMLAGMCSLPNVQFLVIDGKGGSDWEWIESRATWMNDDEDFGAIITALEAVTATMRERVSTLKSLTGSPNIWHTGPTVEMPLLMVVVDECQTFYDSKGMSKEKKLESERITALVTNLVKKGRSAGIFVWSITQKPTADSLPTGLRDNSAVRWACRVMTAEAEVAILGDRGTPSAVELPSALPGAAIIVTETGDRDRIRFDYLPDSAAEAAAQASAHLRRPITTPAPVAG